MTEIPSCTPQHHAIKAQHQPMWPGYCGDALRAAAGLRNHIDSRAIFESAHRVSAQARARLMSSSAQSPTGQRRRHKANHRPLLAMKAYCFDVSQFSGAKSAGRERRPKMKRSPASRLANQKWRSAAASIGRRRYEHIYTWTLRPANTLIAEKALPAPAAKTSSFDQRATLSAEILRNH